MNFDLIFISGVSVAEQAQIEDILRYHFDPLGPLPLPGDVIKLESSSSSPAEPPVTFQVNRRVFGKSSMELIIERLS